MDQDGGHGDYGQQTEHPGSEPVPEGVVQLDVRREPTDSDDTPENPEYQCENKGGEDFRVQRHARFS